MKQIKISLATKFSLAFAAVVLATMAAVTFSVRQTTVTRFTEQYEQAVASSLQTLRADLANRRHDIRRRLGRLAEQLASDNQFRLQFLIYENLKSPLILNYAGPSMRTLGLDALEITDSAGRVLTSGHNLGAYGKDSGPVIQMLQSSESELPLVQVTTPRGSASCLAALESIRIGNRLLYLVGGVQLTPALLTQLTPNPSELIVLRTSNEIVKSTAAGFEDVAVHRFNPQDTTAAPESDRYTTGEFTLPFWQGDSTALAAISLIHPKTELSQLLRAINRRFLLIAGVGIVAAILLASLLARSVAKPLRRLAGAAGTLSLETLDAEFETDSKDEVGVLSKALSDMLSRLRRNRVALASAEKKAAFAQIARQVNHDIKNGFIPIRNVMRHWQEVANTEPKELPRIFDERKASILESVDYLEKLARGYSRLQPELQVVSVSVNDVLRSLVRNYSGVSNSAIELQTHLSTSEPHIMADRVQL